MPLRARLERCLIPDTTTLYQTYYKHIKNILQITNNRTNKKLLEIIFMMDYSLVRMPV